MNLAPKSDLIKDPSTGEVLVLSELYKGNRTVVTPEQLAKYDMGIHSGAIKMLDGTIANAVELILARTDTTKYLDYSGEIIKAENSIAGLTKNLVLKKQQVENTHFDSTKIITLTARPDRPTLHIRVQIPKQEFKFKENTKYTFVFNVVKNTIKGYEAIHLIDNYNATYSEKVLKIQSGETGIILGTILTKNGTAFQNAEFGYNSLLLSNDTNAVVSGEIVVDKFMVLEGDWTNKDIPQFFNGTQSTGDLENNIITLKSSNKNLLNLNSFEIGDISAGTGGDVGHSARSRTKDFIRILPGTYTLSKNVSEWFFVGAYDINKKYIKYLVDANSNKGTFTITSDIKYIRVRLNNHIDTLGGLELQLEEGNIPTKYLQYEEDIKEIQDISLPIKIKTYAETTYLTTTNIIKANISVKIPTDIPGSIQTLKVKNDSLQIENKNIKFNHEVQEKLLLEQSDYIIDTDFRVTMLELGII